MTQQTRPPGGFLEEEWRAARCWADYLAHVEDKRDLWLAHARRAALDGVQQARLKRLPGPRRVLVLTEDWCGDAARAVPVLAHAFERAQGVEHRYLDSDDHPGAIRRYLTHGGRAIPMAIVQDEHGLEVGAWGPRPAPLQALLRERLLDQGPPEAGARAAFYAPIMAWYANDAGRTTVDEILMLLERGGRAR